VRGIFTPELLDQCIACGFCLPVCPTYAMTGVEQDSPRGRISLMRAVEAGQLDADDPTLYEQSSACLGCRACESVCPAGVRYGQLLEEWRDHQWRGRRRPVIARALMLLVRWVWPLRLQGIVRRHARTPAATAPAGPHLMLGCVERGLFPKVSHSALELCPELSAPSGQGCCGALHAHNGDKAGGERLADDLGRRLPGTIVSTAGGCAAHLAQVLGTDRVKELSQYLVGCGRSATGELLVDGRRARVTLQDSCHARAGLGVVAQPRALLRAVADYVELPDAGTCCGAAGSYSLLQKRRSRAILTAKIESIERAGVDYVVTVNPGCQRQLATGLRRAKSKAKVIHIADLLVEARRAADG
jgi:glycolate oxidase iron-sulfur subunit